MFYARQCNYFSYHLKTIAKMGNISTQYFGDKFREEMVDGSIYIYMRVYYPASVIDDKNAIAIYNIEKTTMIGISGNDDLSFVKTRTKLIDPDLTHFSINITAPFSFNDIKLNRRVTANDINALELEQMPGFRVTWNFNKRVDSESKYRNDEITKQYVR